MKYEPEKHEVTAEAFLYYVEFIKDLKAPTNEQMKDILKKMKGEDNEQF